VAPFSHLASASILLIPDEPDYFRDVALSLCDDGSWCRGPTETGRQCCRRGEGLFIKDGEASRRTAPDAKTPSPVNGTSRPSPSKNPISAAAMAGIGIGAGLSVGVGLCVVAIAAVFGVRMLRRRRNPSQERAIDTEKEVCLRCSPHNDESLAPPSTAIYSTDDVLPESVELEWRSLSANERLSYVRYRASDPQDEVVPAELPSERSPNKYDTPGSA
jgi:hypothetical protein